MRRPTGSRKARIPDGAEEEFVGRHHGEEVDRFRAIEKTMPTVVRMAIEEAATRLPRMTRSTRLRARKRGAIDGRQKAAADRNSQHQNRGEQRAHRVHGVEVLGGRDHVGLRLIGERNALAGQDGAHIAAIVDGGGFLGRCHDETARDGADHAA